MNKSDKKNKVIKFKLSDILELALKSLQTKNPCKGKCEYSCDAISQAASKYLHGVTYCKYYDFRFPIFVKEQWEIVVENCMGTSLYSTNLFDEFYDEKGATLQSQYARAIFLTFGIILLKEYPELDNCTYSNHE